MKGRKGSISLLVLGFAHIRLAPIRSTSLNPLECSATSNNMKLVHWPLMGGPLHLVQRAERGGGWKGPQPAQACAKCNSPPIS